MTKEGHAALVIAHPAHELRILGWLQQARPVVFVLTTGQGRTSPPRIDRTCRVLESLQCRPGTLVGALTDQQIYNHLQCGRLEPLAGVVDRLADGFIRERVDYVVCDAREDAILSHDVLHAITRVACEVASRRLGRQLPCYDFVLEASPSACPEEARKASIWIQLEDSQLLAKVEIARSYAEVRDEVELAIETFGLTAFATECLRPSAATDWSADPLDRPLYESHAERLVAEGVYPQAIQFHRHVRPFMDLLVNRYEVAGGLRKGA
ncbi:MAG: hypothetical protein D6753_18900 [Planctomycetota bacterium]|nr:MAG: hypothetical protein D6753_18900 [Planctomycetota bacterium]